MLERPLVHACAVVSIVALAGCGGEVAAASAPCVEGDAGANVVPLTATCSASTADACGADTAAARAQLETKLRACFTSSVADVFAIVPTIQVAATGCLASFTWLEADAGLPASKACVERTLAQTPRWSCFVAPACAGGATVVTLGR